jgi:hypothetical protein
MTSNLRRATTPLLLSLWLSACSSDNDSAVTYSIDPDTIDVSQADYCDITQPDQCLFPFPNDFFSVADERTDTGRRIAFDPGAMPENTAQDPFDVTEHNRNDGFSPGPVLLAHVPDVDLQRTGAAPITDIARSLDSDAPIQLIHAASGERQLLWAELDAYPEAGQPRALLLRMAKNLREGERYIVVLQNLLDSTGNALVPSDAFSVYQQGIPSTVPELEARRDHFEELFSTLGQYGIQRNDLFLAWDFTVASTASLTGRILHMRDTALADLAGAPPPISVTSVIDNTPAEDANWAREVRGTLTVPNFLNTIDGRPGSRLHYASDDPDALPIQLNGNAMLEVPFLCAIPHAAFADAVDGNVDTRAVVMGHGLYSSRNSVVGMGPMAQAENLVFCAMDWWGMSNQDIATTFGILANISLFPAQADRLQQGFLNKILMSKAIVDSAGFADMSAFQNADGTALFKSGEVHFDGVSQGAILGGALSAVNPYLQRSVLNVAGINFSLLIRRSSAWSSFALAFDPAYPDPLVRPLALALTQMLWDRGENNGYANHVTRDLLPGSTPTRVLIHTAVGDQTVNETTGEVLARSLAIPRHNPTVATGRHIAVDPYVGIAPITTYPHSDSGLVVWDSGPLPIDSHAGTPLQRTDNIPQNGGYNTHGMPFRQRNAWQQKADFWRTGTVENVCGPTACLADGYDGTPGEYNPEE